MFSYISGGMIPLVAFIGILFSFVATCLFIHLFEGKLPTDAGREYALNGAASKGKPRGAGFVFISVFVVSTLLFAELDKEIIIYLILVFAAMLTGYFDDAAEHPWGEYKKAALDFIIAVVAAWTYIRYNANVIKIACLDMEVTIPVIVMGILIVILVWTSINVTNCSDGVDGLSGTLTIITIITIYILTNILKSESNTSYLILLFAVSILGYLWYNANPSKLLMGDAGSRAMGLFIALMILKSGSPFLYIPVAIVLIIDGGLGLIKVFLLRFLKIHILKNTRTPIHDNVRKVKGWSDTQTVFRFAIIQIVVSVATVYLVLMSV